MEGKTDKIKAATIGVFHHDCQTSLSTEKFPGIRLEQLSPVVFLSNKPGKIDYSLLWDIHAGSRTELAEYLNFVNKDSETIKMHVLERENTRCLMLLRFRGTSSSYDTVLRNGVIYSQNITAQGGYEMHTVIAPDPSALGKAFWELSCIGDVKVLRLGDFRSVQGGITPAITQKQADALKVALINNYYSWPRGATLEQLAGVAKISRRSMQERLRRAEAKLFPAALKDYLRKRF